MFDATWRVPRSRCDTTMKSFILLPDRRSSPIHDPGFFPRFQRFCLPQKPTCTCQARLGGRKSVGGVSAQRENREGKERASCVWCLGEGGGGRIPRDESRGDEANEGWPHYEVPSLRGGDGRGPPPTKKRFEEGKLARRGRRYGGSRGRGLRPGQQDAASSREGGLVRDGRVEAPFQRP